MTLLDSIVRQAYRESPESAHRLIQEVDTWKNPAMRWIDLPHMPWADFLARIRDLYRHASR